MIEDSFVKAYTTNINDVIITADFNSNMLSNCNNTLHNIIQSYGFTQMISEPTHFTEASSSLLDLFIVRNTLSAFKNVTVGFFVISQNLE